MMKPLPPVAALQMRTARSLASLPVQVNMTLANSGRQRRQELLGELQGQLGQIAGMGVERGGLARQRLDHLRVAVTHDRNIVVGVEIGAPLLVVHPHVRGAHDLQRLVVEQLVGRCQQARTAREQICRGRRHGRISSVSSCAASASRA